MGSKAPDQSKKKAADSQQVLPALIRYTITINLVPVQRAAFRGLEALGHSITIFEVFCKGHHGQNRSPSSKKGKGVGEVTLVIASHFQSPSPRPPKNPGLRLQLYLSYP